MTDKNAGLAVLGGTFDPVHYGHLHSAVAVRDLLSVDSIRLMPSYMPPHRNLPQTSASQRLEMLRIAISQYDGLELDEREILRQGVSYTIDTLRSLRSDIGPQAALCFVLGFDSYRTLNEWQRWQELSDVAHLLVLARPGFSAALPAEIALWASDKMVDEASRMMESPCGNICCVELVQLEISATEIRQMIAAGGSPEEMTTQGVIDYIRQQGLYRC